MGHHQTKSIHVQVQQPLQTKAFSKSATTYQFEGNSEIHSYLQEDQYFPS